MERVFGPGSSPLCGEVKVPGDKSLSHRAVLFSAMAEGVSHVSGLLDSADVRSTIEAVRALGAKVALAIASDGSLEGSIEGWGAAGPQQPAAPIDCGNSGTTARLLMGMLAGWPIEVTLVGDASLSIRPMRRVADPLVAMGAEFILSEGGTLPVTIRGAASLRPFDHASPVASAQVKTAVLLAGLRAAGGVRVTEPSLSRDHTERLLPAYGVAVKSDPRTCSASLCGPQVPVATDVAVPGDPSSAAFLVAAALLVPGSEIALSGVSLNPTRTGMLRVLERMGAHIELTQETLEGSEPVGRISARYTPALEAGSVAPDEVPALVDEVPVLALIASQAHGTSHFSGIGELRVKESDRLAAIAQGLSVLGADVEESPDALRVHGPAELEGGTLDSLGDHRLAMTWALAGLIGKHPVTVRRFDAVDVSYPGFVRDIAALAGNA